MENDTAHEPDPDDVEADGDDADEATPDDPSTEED
jgi:hypothetical protein